MVHRQALQVHHDECEVRRDVDLPPEPVPLSAIAVVSQFKLFRYVSWHSNGIAEATLQALEKEIAADSTAASDKLKALRARKDLSEQESASLEAIEKTWEKYRQVAKSTIEIAATVRG